MPLPPDDGWGDNNYWSADGPGKTRQSRLLPCQLQLTSAIRCGGQMKTNQQRLQRRVFAAKTAFALAAIVLFGCSHNAAAQGNTSPWPSSGSVGIGTTSPVAPLEVQQAASPTVPNLYLSQASTLSKSVFQFINVGGNTWSYFGHNVYYDHVAGANTLIDTT